MKGWELLYYDSIIKVTSSITINKRIFITSHGKWKYLNHWKKGKNIHEKFRRLTLENTTWKIEKNEFYKSK